MRILLYVSILFFVFQNKFLAQQDSIGICSVPEANYNLNYKKFVDSLWKHDQATRRNPKFIKASKYVRQIEQNKIEKINQKRLKRSLALYNYWITSDSLNSLTFIRKIEESGFPSKQKVGVKTYKRGIEILIHFGLNDCDSVYQSILDNALFREELEVTLYAYMVDCQRVKKGESQLYCQYNSCKYQELNEKERTKILENRKKIGLAVDTYFCGGKKNF